METLSFRDFSAGWIPSDDPINGRKNGLLKMNAVELDSNGALTLTNGTKNWRSTNYPADAHTIYSKFISGVRKQYVSMTNGEIYRDATRIITGGSVLRTAFCSGFDYVFIFSGTERYRDDGTTLTPIGIPAAPAPTVGAANSPGDGILSGNYEYAQLNVYNSGGAYKAQSKLSPIASVTLDRQDGIIAITSPSAPGNEVWTFRRGGNLDNWYRVKVSSTPYNAFIDNLSDADALLLNRTTDTEIFSLVDLTDDILEAIPSFAQRFIYFTKTSIIFSEINSPDNYNPKYVMDITSSNSITGTEMFLWARKVGENIILVGTTSDVYVLSGTLRLLPDGTLDVYLRGLGVDFPPIGIDAAVYNKTVIYMAKEGWRMMGLDGSSFSLVSPNTDKLYRGTSVTFHEAIGAYKYYDYGAIPTYIHPQLRYTCAVTKDKLWVTVPVITENDSSGTFIYRTEVYDFIRKYWRPMPFNFDQYGSYDEGQIIGSPATWQVFPPTLLFAEDDGALLGFFKEYNIRNLREVDHPPFTSDGKLNNSLKQIVDVLTLFNDNGKPYHTKTSQNARIKIDTGGDNLTLTIYGTESKFQTPLDPGVVKSKVVVLNSTRFEEQIININSLGDVNGFAVQLQGQVANFLCTGIDIDYELHPEKIKYFTLLSQYYGPNKKRPRVWPFVINTFGQDVVFVPIIDGVAGTPSVFNTNDKTTVFHHFTTDVFGNDYSGYLHGNSYFELWNVGQPIFVQTLPIVKRFDQIGPEELFRYGKIKAFELRLLSMGSPIHFKMYFNDTVDYEGDLVIEPEKIGKEFTYFIGAPKTTAGEIIRLELGPTAFDFYRFYTRLQVTRSGRESDIEYLVLQNE